MQLLSTRLSTVLATFCFLLPIVSLVAPKAVVPLLFLAAVLALATALREGRRPMLPDTVLLLAGSAFVILCALSAAWGFEPAEAFLRALRVGAVLAAGILLCSLAALADEETRMRCGNALFLGLALAYAVALFDTMSGSALFNLVKGSTGSAYHDASRLNRGITAMAMLIWPLVALLWRNGWSWRCLCLPLGLLIYVAFTQATAGLIGLGLALLTTTVALAWPRCGRFIVIASLLIAFVAVAPLASWAYDLGWSRAEWLFGSAQHRIHVWNFVAERMVERPFFGWGFAASRDMPNFGEVAHNLSPGSVIPLHPHNAPLQILLELGMVGALASLAVLWGPLRYVDRQAPVSRACGQAMFIATLVVASTAYGLWQNHWLALICCAAAVFILLAPEPRAATVQPAANSGRSTPSCCAARSSMPGRGLRQGCAGWRKRPTPSG